MAFVPKNANSKSTGQSTYDPNKVYPTPKNGLRPGRISLIVDLGIQEREDFEDTKTGEVKAQKPVQQVVVYADLTHDVVDYGGKIGKQPYRICLNKSYQGDIAGVNFVAVAPRDADGNQITGKKWGFHPQNLLTKIAKAVQKPEVIETMDIEEFLDQQLMVQTEVKKTESTTKKDDEGNSVVYTNVNCKGLSETPMVENEDTGDEQPMKVKPLATPAMIVSFDNAEASQIKYLRKNIIAKIKQATNYAGSKMEAAIQAYEKQQNTQQEASSDGGEEFVPEVKETPKPAAKKAPVAAKKPVDEPEDFDDSDSPFN